MFLRKTLKPSSIITTLHRSLTTIILPDPPTSAAYDALITTAGTNQDFTTIRYLLTHRYAKGFFTTNNTFKFISSNPSLIKDLQSTISELTGNARKKSYESLVACLCKNNLLDEAEATAQEAQSCADASTFHPIISALTRGKNFARAWHVVKSMKEKQIARDVTCYNYFLTSYAVIGELGPCVDVLKKMREEGVKADARTYDALVLGACKCGKMDGAMMIMRKMVEDGVEAMYATYAHVIGSLVKLGYCAQAVKFVMSYEGIDKKLDAHNFGLLAARLVSAKKMDEAKNVFEEMVKRGLDMDENVKTIYDTNVKVLNKDENLD